MKQAILTAGLIGFCFTPSEAQNPCACPKISLEQAKKILREGKMVDAIPGYIAFAQKTMKSEDIDQITKVTQKPSYLDSDDNCICEYEAMDATGKEIYVIGLEANEGINKEPSER